MSFKDLTTEQRQAMAEKSAATRRAKKAQRTAHAAMQPAVTPEAIVDRAIEMVKAGHKLGFDDEQQLPPPEIVYGEILEPGPATHPDHSPTLNEPFQLFLFSLDAETKELLGIDELREIYAAQVAKAFAEKKASKKKSAADQAMHAARMEAGLVPMATREAMETARRNAELVRFTVELPPAGDQGEVPDIGLRIDQKVYLHGHTYTLPRAQYDSYREMIYRAGEHELTFKGQNRRQRQWLLGRALGSVDRHIPLNESLA